MRVIGGFYRSRVIQAPAGLNTRPTMDNVKEAMFNIIGPSIQNSICLDLFSGSGNLGIECLSRGAKFVYFNDYDNDAFNCIKTNLSVLKIDNEKISLTKYDYMECLAKIDNNLDFVFLDPPYKNKIYEEVINYLIQNDKLNAHAMIVCECDLNQPTLDFIGFKTKEYKYGKKKLNVLRRLV